MAKLFIEGDEYELSHELNVDLIVTTDPQTGQFIIKGKKSNVLVAKLSILYKTIREIILKIIGRAIRAIC